MLEETIREAYADCWLPWDEGSQRRNLDFRATSAVSRDEARRILHAAIPGGYNEFEADLVLKLPSGAKITIAREGSVCLYIQNASFSQCSRLEADEIHNENGEIRLWWD